MDFSTQHKELIAASFPGIRNKEDILELLKTAQKIVYGHDAKTIQLKHLTYYADASLSKRRYKTFFINKKSGGHRIIQSPQKGLKIILRSLNYILQNYYSVHASATGFVPQKSIVDNAKLHTGQNYVYNIDLKDFFHAFDKKRVKYAFMCEPFNLNGDKEPLAFLLASLCTHPTEIDGKIKSVLPQGSPTSPTLTNILCKTLDRRLNGMANRFGVTYSRYADDITFSSQHNIYKNYDFQEELQRIITTQGFKINPKKTRLQKRGYKQEVTGLVVNKKTNLHRRYIKQIRQLLYFWERYGYEKAQALFIENYLKDKGHIKPNNAKIENVLMGKILFIKMVKGEKDSTYLKLNKRYEDLVSKDHPFQKRIQIDSKILEGKIYLNDIEEVLGDDCTFEIASIKHKLKQKIKSSNLDINSNRSIDKRHNPKEMVTFLYKFSVDEKLKWFAHRADFNVDKINYTKTIKDFKTLIGFFRNINISTFFFVQNFITQSNWKRNIKIEHPLYEVKYGYSHPNVYQKIENGENPFDITIKNNVHFADIIKRFKHAIQFRTDSIEYTFENLFKDFVTEKISVDIIEEYTGSFNKYAPSLDAYIDTNNFFKGIGVIISWINDNKVKSTKLEIDIQNEDDYYELIVFHKGSYMTKDPDGEKIKGISGDWEKLKTYWFSIVDWSIQADLKYDKKSKCYNIICLDKNSTLINNQVSENKKTSINKAVGGIKHIIKIYKTKNL